MLWRRATPCGQACYLRSVPLLQRQSSGLIDYSSTEDTISVVSIFRCWFVSMYCLTTLKKLCCRCVMGYSFFCRNGRHQRQHAWPFGVARLQSIQRVSPASPNVFSTSHLQQHLQKESLIHSNIWNKLDEKSVSAKSLKRFKRQLQRLHTDGLFPT